MAGASMASRPAENGPPAAIHRDTEWRGLQAYGRGWWRGSSNTAGESQSAARTAGYVSPLCSWDGPRREHGAVGKHGHRTQVKRENAMSRRLADCGRKFQGVARPCTRVCTVRGLFKRNRWKKRCSRKTLLEDNKTSAAGSGPRKAMRTGPPAQANPALRVISGV